MTRHKQRKSPNHWIRGLGEKRIGLERGCRGGVVNGEGAEANVEEFALTATGGMAIEEADIHATAVVGGGGIDTGFGMAGVECPGIVVGVVEEDGVAIVGAFGRGFAGIDTIVAGVIIPVANREITENIFSD